jgi:4-methyl-5(b-hydroxyethyl)-thiazole monophosphate biosynthesis
MAKKVILILADGFEEIEALTPIDLLRRAGVEVVIAGLSGKTQVSARGVRVGCDVLLADILPTASNFDALVLPGGGKGAENLAASRDVLTLTEGMHKARKIIAAICAAPAVVLSKTSVLDGKSATCFPGMENDFEPRTTFRAQPVVVDGNVVTSRGAGTALAFALTLIELLVDKPTRDKIARAIVAE